MHLPNRIFFTGAPGSRWSGIAQIIEDQAQLNVTDRSDDRSYSHGKFSGHKGAYFGPGMEFPAKFGVVDSAHKSLYGTKLIKSHEWSKMLNDITNHFPGDGILVVHRDTLESFKWWKEAGGFDIEYPSYSAYKDDQTMLAEIHVQTLAIEKFCLFNSIDLVPFTNEWLKQNFNVETEEDLSKYSDVKVAYVTWK